MADIIEGTSPHAQHAPPSLLQTVAVGRYLQDRIAELEGQLADLARGLRTTNEALEHFRKSVPTQHSESKLRESIGDVVHAADVQRADLARTTASVGKLQGGLDATNDQDLAAQSASQLRLQRTLERRMQKDITQLGDNLVQANLEIKQLQKETEMFKVGLNEEREKMRLAGLRLKEGADDLKSLSTALETLETYVAANTAGRKAALVSLDDMATTIKKLHDEKEHAKKGIADVLGKVQKVHEHLKFTHSKVDATSQALGVTQGELSQTTTDMHNLRKSMESAISKLQSLGEGHNLSSQSIQALQFQLAEVGATTQAVKAGLKEHSSLLLPNITLDSVEARNATARHGSLLAVGLSRSVPPGRVTPSGRATPRQSGNTTLRYPPMQEMAWT